MSSPRRTSMLAADFAVGSKGGPTEPADSPDQVMRRGAPKWIIPLGLSASYLLFAVAVHLRMLDSLDVTVRNAARPNDVWGSVQIDANRVVDGLQPVHLVLPLMVIVTVLGIVRRSVRPLVATAVVGAPIVIVTLGTKWLMARTELVTTPASHARFPSGHTGTIIAAFGLIVLLLGPRTCWRWLIPTCFGLLMGSALILVGAHTATDVLGAGPLAAAALSGARAARR